jgi:HK97 family phage prohead protease
MLKDLFYKWQSEQEEQPYLDGIEPEPEPFEGLEGKAYVEKDGIRVEKREVDFVASTPDQDADGDIVEQDFVFDRFLKNPVILFAHNSRALPIGKAANVRVEGGVLRMTVQFASKKANPLAENVFLLIKEKILRAMSIGFIPRDIRREMKDDKEVWVLSQNELIESSVVPIPSNQNALAELKAKAMTKSKTAPDQETNKDTTMKADELQKQVVELTEKNAAMSTELEALKARQKSLEELRNEEKERANKAELALIERDIDELVGKKISAKEKDGLLKCAAANRELYEEQMTAIKDRPNMNLCETTVLPDEKPEPRQLPAPDEKSGADFASLVLRRAGLNN